jgi:hypothetical protein
VTVDDGPLNQALAGTRFDRGQFSLIATGNQFDVSVADRTVSLQCGWRDWDSEASNPQLQFDFAAEIHADPVRERARCPITLAGQQVDTTIVQLGRFPSCRVDDRFSVRESVIDDNAIVTCGVSSVDASLLPALEQAMRPVCQGFIDDLAHARPISYLGGTFWTVR